VGYAQAKSGQVYINNEKIVKKSYFCPEKVGRRPVLDSKSGLKNDGIWRNLTEFNGI